MAHLCILEVSDKATVDEAFVEDVDECVVLDMGCKVKLPVRCLDAPFFLELGGSLPVVCEVEVGKLAAHEDGAMRRAGRESDGGGKHVLDSSKYLSCQVSETVAGTACHERARNEPSRGRRSAPKRERAHAAAEAKA